MSPFPARRTRIVAAALAAACAGPPSTLGTTAAPVDTAVAGADARITADVAWLAAPARAGRLAGTKASDSVAAYLARRYEALGLRGAFVSACDGDSACAAAYVQRFVTDEGTPAHNVVARVPGRDATLAAEVVIVGAHMDHIGRNAFLSMDPDDGPVLHPGADDNASGTAAVLELARRLAAHPTRRTVLLAHFDAEEEGLLGSRAFVDQAPVPREAVRLMVNLDMVGRLRGDRLYVDVARGGRAVEALVDSVARAAALHPESTAETEGRSDHASFARWHVPAVALFTGFHPDYHRASDIASRVNADGIRRIVDVTEGIVRAVADAR